MAPTLGHGSPRDAETLCPVESAAARGHNAGIMNEPNSTMLDESSLDLLRAALDKLEAGFGALPPIEAALPPADTAAVERVLLQVAERLHDNYPYFHPLYAGQMMKPPHPVARLAYALAMWINPNNHALDGGRATTGSPITR